VVNFAVETISAMRNARYSPATIASPDQNAVGRLLTIRRPQDSTNPSRGTAQSRDPG
jgi:hypothetical protein